MTSEEEIRRKARNFLQVVSENVQTTGNIKVVQKGVWWSSANPSDSKVVVRSSGTMNMSQMCGHEREIFNLLGVGIYYQTQLRDHDFPEQTELHAEIIAAGIEPQWIQFGFLLPLIYAWCSLPEPLDLTHSATQHLLNIFADAVIGHKSTTTYRDALVHVDLGGAPVVLEEGIVLRPISEDELYELSQEKFRTEPYTIQFSTSDKWSILEIQINHLSEDSANIYETIYNIREAIIAGFASANTRSYTLLPLGQVTNFGVNAMGSMTMGSQLPREFGRTFPGVTSTLGPDTRHKIVSMWPRVKKIMIPGSNYLALPLRRLVDGLARSRSDDKIIDYSIGLEALLTAAARDELSYRFALRGAMILGRTGYDRSKAFGEFKNLYGARSTIVHGGSTAKLNLGELAANGERLLRVVWDWYFRQDMTLKGANDRIDSQILASD